MPSPYNSPSAAAKFPVESNFASSSSLDMFNLSQNQMADGNNSISCSSSRGDDGGDDGDCTLFGSSQPSDRDRADGGVGGGDERYQSVIIGGGDSFDSSLGQESPFTPSRSYLGPDVEN